MLNIPAAFDSFAAPVMLPILQRLLVDPAGLLVEELRPVRHKSILRVDDEEFEVDLSVYTFETFDEYAKLVVEDQNIVQQLNGYEIEEDDIIAAENFIVQREAFAGQMAERVISVVMGDLPPETVPLCAAILDISNGREETVFSALVTLYQRADSKSYVILVNNVVNTRFHTDAGKVFLRPFDVDLPLSRFEGSTKLAADLFYRMIPAEGERPENPYEFAGEALWLIAYTREAMKRGDFAPPVLLNINLAMELFHWNGENRAKDMLYRALLEVEPNLTRSDLDLSPKLDHAEAMARDWSLEEDLEEGLVPDPDLLFACVLEEDEGLAEAELDDIIDSDCAAGFVVAVRSVPEWDHSDNSRKVGKIKLDWYVSLGFVAHDVPKKFGTEEALNLAQYLAQQSDPNAWTTSVPCHFSVDTTVYHPVVAAVMFPFLLHCALNYVDSDPLFDPERSLFTTQGHRGELPAFLLCLVEAVKANYKR